MIYWAEIYERLTYTGWYMLFFFLKTRFFLNMNFQNKEQAAEIDLQEFYL